MRNLIHPLPSSADYKLLPGEKLLDIETFPLRHFEHHPSTIEQIKRLTNSPDSGRIGESGPSIASLAFDVSSQTSVNPDISPLDDNEANQSSIPDHLRLYEVLFGRDSLRVAIDLISSYPELARTTVLELAKLQGITYNHQREEEPGRIVHEARDKDDPIAEDLTRRLGWGWPYYGSVDATPEFIRTLTAYVRKTEENHAFLSQKYVDRSGSERDIAYALDMAIDWIIERIESNSEGLLEFKSELEKGIENQVWKDSWDAYHHKDGTLANHSKGIASIEVQVTAYDALLDAAHLYRHVLDDEHKATILTQKAHELAQVILSVFWTEDEGGYFVLGTDRDDNGNLRQLKIKTSNMGHTLNSRLLESRDPDISRKRHAVVRHIVSDKLLNVSGIRTLATDETRFRPGAYHCGSVWLWDTHHIAKGLRRHGLHADADAIDRRLLHVVNETKIFPEYVRGDDSSVPSINTTRITILDTVNNRENIVEQPPQEVQAWTVAAILAIKKRLDRRQKAIDRRKLEMS